VAKFSSFGFAEGLAFVCVGKTHSMYQITNTLPKSKHKKTKLLKMDEQQAELHQIIE